MQSNQQYYKQTYGLVMGTLSSAILAETHLQYLEYEYICPILISQQITALLVQR